MTPLDLDAIEAERVAADGLIMPSDGEALIAEVRRLREELAFTRRHLELNLDNAACAISRAEKAEAELEEVASALRLASTANTEALSRRDAAIARAESAEALLDKATSLLDDAWSSDCWREQYDECEYTALGPWLASTEALLDETQRAYPSMFLGAALALDSTDGREA